MSASLLNTVINTGRISYRLGGWEPPWGIEYVIDYLNGFVLVVVSFIAFIITIYSKRARSRRLKIAEYISSTPYMYSFSLGSWE